MTLNIAFVEDTLEPHTVKRAYGVVVPMPTLPLRKIVNP